VFVRAKVNSIAKARENSIVDFDGNSLLKGQACPLRRLKKKSTF